MLVKGPLVINNFARRVEIALDLMWNQWLALIGVDRNILITSDRLVHTVTSRLQFESNQRKQRKICTLHNLPSSLDAEIYSQDKLVLVWRMRSKEHSTYTSFVMVLWDLQKKSHRLTPPTSVRSRSACESIWEGKPCRFERITVIYVAPTCSHIMLLRITDT